MKNGDIKLEYYTSKFIEALKVYVFKKLKMINFKT